MDFLISTILWLLLAMLVSVCLALITPVIFKVHLTTSPQLGYRVEMRALAGLAPYLTLAKRPHKDPAPKAMANQHPKPVEPKKRKISRFRRTRGSVIRAVPPLVGDVLQRINIAELHIDADYGLGDPADTGQLCGLLIPLQYACSMPASVSLDLRPDFTQTRLTGSLTMVIRITIAALFIPLLHFAWRAYGPAR
jgi:hypothetical protein